MIKNAIGKSASLRTYAIISIYFATLAESTRIITINLTDLWLNMNRGHMTQILKNKTKELFFLRCRIC